MRRTQVLTLLRLTHDRVAEKHLAIESGLRLAGTVRKASLRFWSQHDVMACCDLMLLCVTNACSGDALTHNNYLSNAARCFWRPTCII